MIVAAAMALDALLGEPRWLWSRLHHPAVLFGRLIDRVDTDLNHGENRREKGILLVALLILGGAVLGVLITKLPFDPIWEVICAAILLAHRSLVDHVDAVARALRLSVGDGRLAAAHIVGRDLKAADRPQIARAAIESAAENFSDAVIAPLFWFVLFGLPGILVYKLINTADSMVGYRTERHLEFGWAAARIDDLVNWIPARLTAILFLAIDNRLHQFSAVRTDAKRHRSPNAGWPEAALARILDTALAGPRSYDGKMQDFAFVHPEGNHNSGPDDIDRAVGVLWKAWAVVFVVVLLIGLF